MTRQVQHGDTAKIGYTGKMQDDTVFDSTEGREPFEFVVGDDDVIAGVSKGVVGMAVGDKKTLTIGPAEGFGDPDPKMLLPVAASQLPEGVGVGDTLTDDQEPPHHWRVHEITGDTATLDGNHPLAGQTLTFDIEVLDIR